MSAVAVRCDSCGGTVVVPGGAGLPHCLFCGEAASHLVPATVSADELVPERRASSRLDEAGAGAVFEKWRGGFVMAPFAITRAPVRVRLVYVPALRFRGEMETHWVGMVGDTATWSGRRPVAGMDAEEVRDAFVPASRVLRADEMRGLGPFGEEYDAINADAVGEPVEVGHVSERGLRGRGLSELAWRHAREIEKRHALVAINAASLERSLQSEVVLVPVWIGAYRLRRMGWRWMCNGVTGQVVGVAPWSRVKVATVICLVLSVFTCNPMLLLVLLGMLVAWKVGWMED